ncbi:MAG TPA: alpha/beta hydrolase-fold protein [Pyrinomonadaceae bacterium]|jgi:predicted alpha/beta superfamily hydrolase|nr:alpha/beta hydrolase-fold protein [Pyrinomonadaceae bacterium]
MWFNFLRTILILLFLAAPALVAFSQRTPGPPASHEISVYHQRHIIRSTYLNEERSILVRVPPGYDRYDRSTESYPVIYMLDGHGSYLSMMPGIIESQSWGGQMPEVILVSIQNTDRTRDLTPTRTERAGSGNSGGGDKFLDFLQNEVMPLVEKSYRTAPYRIFAGHSLGGLAVVYSFVSRPDMFNAYIAASPVLHWDKGFVLKRAEEVLKQNKNWNKTMFVAVGDEPDYIDGFNSFKNLLDKAKPKNFSYEFRQFKDDNHGSVPLPAYYAGLRKIFKGWALPPVQSLKEMEDHYRELSKKFGYEIKPPEDILNQLGFELLRAKNVAGAIEAFKRNAELYPASANTYDSLASAYEADGDLKKARELFEKAYKMAETSGEAGLAKSSKENFERLTAKLK